MKGYTTIRSWGALVLAGFFAVVTARTLFDDVWNGAPVTTAHLQSLAAIVGAIASGHLLAPMFKQAKIATLIGMMLIFASSTGYVVISAGARNAQASATKAVAAETQNASYAAALDKLADAEADLKTAKDTAKTSAAAAAKECSSGKKTKCEGREATRDFDAKQVEKAESHVLMMQARVSVLKPVADPHSGYAHAAKVLAALPFVTADVLEIETRLDLLLPFVMVLISEIGVLVFGGLALGHRQRLPATDRPANRPAEATVNIRPANATVKSKVVKKQSLERGRKADPEVLAFIANFRLVNAGRSPTPAEIRSAFPVMPKSTSIDYAARSRSAPALKLVVG